MKYFILLLFTALLGACQPKTQENEIAISKGFDHFGFANACESVHNGICPDSWDYQSDDRFQRDCAAANYKVVACPCGPSLCSGKMLTGLDAIGNVRSCAANPKIQPGCIEDGAATDLAEDCRARGGKAVACGCNDYICVGGAQP